MSYIFKYISFIIIILLCLGCSGGRGQVQEIKNDEVNDIVLQDNTITYINLADSILACLTLEERIGQCFMPALNTVSDSQNIKVFKKYIDDLHVGGVVLFAGDLNSLLELRKVGTERKVPLFFSIDAEWGLGMRLSDAPVFPKNGNINKETEETVMFDYGREVARESRIFGINMILGPVVDINIIPGSEIGRRSFGNDAYRVANLAVSYAKGLESGGVISVAKHFPGHGAAQGNSHVGKSINFRSITEIDSVELLPFREYINSGLSGIMASHIQVPSISNEMLPSSVSYDILSVLLRDEMGFQGLIITDAFNMAGVKGYEGWEALQAGIDIVICPNDVEREINKLMDKIEAGKFDSRIIDERCRRILFYKALFGLWEREGYINNQDSIFNKDIENIKERLL